MKGSSRMDELRKIDQAKEYLRTVRITNEAFKKINLYHAIVRDIMGTPYECSGLSLNKSGRQDNIARDAMLIRGQDIGLAQDTNQDLTEAYSTVIEKGFKVVGPWHSHGNIEPFHSGTDETKIRAVYAKNRLSLPNYIPVGWHTKTFGKEDITITTGKNGVLTIAQADTPRNKVLELVYKEPSRINLRFSEGTNPIIIKSIEDYLQNNLSEIDMPVEKALFYMQSIVINEEAARWAEKIEKKQHPLPRCSLRALIQKEPFSEEYAELKDGQLELELVDETNGITLDEKVLREEVYDSVYVDGVPIREYEQRRKSSLTQIVNKFLPGKKKKDKEPAEDNRYLLDEVKKQKVRELSLLLDKEDSYLDPLLRAEMAVKESKKDHDYAPILRSGYFRGQQLFNSIKQKAVSDPESKEKIMDLLGYVNSPLKVVMEAYIEFFKEHHPNSKLPISADTINCLINGDPISIFQANPTPEGVGKKNGQLYGTEKP